MRATDIVRSHWVCEHVALRACEHTNYTRTLNPVSRRAQDQGLHSTCAILASRAGFA